MAEVPDPIFTELISNAELLKIIECALHEGPFPGICMCTTGHRICKLVEQMVFASTQTCVYKDDGCQFEGNGKVMKDHIKICSYRSFKCPGGGSRNQCLLTIKLSQAKEHFLATHKLEKTDSKRVLPFQLPFTHVVEDHSKFKQDTWWSPSLIEQDGKSFLGQLYTRDDIMYWTLFCIGTKEEAANYKAKIIFSSETNKDIALQWKILVQPIVKCEELRVGIEMKNVLIPLCSLNDFKKVAVRDDGASKYVFHIEYKISKRE